MTTKQKSSRRRRNAKRGGKRRRNLLNRVIENGLIDRVSEDEYRRKVRNVYSGPQGALLSTASRLSLHLQLGERLIRSRQFDLRGARQVLDVGSGAGQLLQHVLKYADPEVEIVACDLSANMLRRARSRLDDRRPLYLAADLGRLPVADASFDCITCGYVLEHLPEARPGLSELSRVLKPGGRMLLLTTEDNFGGAWTSRFWRCRTYNRKELYRVIDEVGLARRQELWFSGVHKALRAGGICVELEKPKAN